MKESHSGEKKLLCGLMVQRQKLLFYQTAAELLAYFMLALILSYILLDTYVMAYYSEDITFAGFLYL